MKKLFSFLLVGIMVAILASSAVGATGTQVGETQGLFIKLGPIGHPGWQTDVGTVQLHRIGSDYHIRIGLAPNWYIFEAHFDYGTPYTWEGIPLAGNGNNPVPGLFDYGAIYSPPQSLEVEFPVGPIPDGTWAFLLHAMVGYSTDGGLTFSDIRTAWGDCQIFPSTKWAKFWIINLPSGETVLPVFP